MKLLFALVFTGLATAGPLPIPQGWKPWAARPEIAPRTFVDEIHKRSGAASLGISGASNAAAYGGWEYTAAVEPGRWYRLSAVYRAEGLTYERGQVVARLDWKKANGGRAGQPEFAYRSTRDGEWTRIVSEAPAPDDARAVTVELYLSNAPQATVWWDEVLLDAIAAPEPRKVTVASLNFRPESAVGSAGWTAAIEKAVPKNADVILLGEGITVVGTGKKPVDVAETIPGPMTGWLGAVAKQRNAWIVAGMYEREGATVYNTALVFDRSGRVAGKYRKVYLPREEIEAGLTPGNDYPVFDTDFGRMGVMICWDLQYADPARALALRGAELVLLPIWGGNTTLGKARAIENHVFLAASGYDYPTEIVDPMGEVIARAPERGTAAVATIDLNRRYVDPWLGDMRGRFMKELRLDVPVTAGH